MATNLESKQTKRPKGQTPENQRTTKKQKKKLFNVQAQLTMKGTIDLDEVPLLH